MGERICLAARTSLDPSYPPYVNFSIEGRVVTVHVRGKGYDDGRGYFVCGPEASMQMDVTVFKQMLGEAVSELILLGSKASHDTRLLIQRSMASQLSIGEEPGLPAIANRSAPDVTVE